MLQLQEEYTFWYGTFVKGQYSQQTIGSFKTAEDFWGYFQHFVKPEQQPEGTQIFLFKSNVQPAWEHAGNKNGGRFLFRVRKSFGNKIFEDLMLAFIGRESDYHDYINGVVSHTKKGFIQMSVWIKDFQKQIDVFSGLEKWIKEMILQLKENREIDFVFHPLT